MKRLFDVLCVMFNIRYHPRYAFRKKRKIKLKKIIVSIELSKLIPPGIGIMDCDAVCVAYSCDVITLSQV